MTKHTIRDMHILDQGIVLASVEDTKRQSLTFPGICVLPDGTWMVSCRAAPKKEELDGEHILISRSMDKGKTWSEPEAPYSPPPLNGRPGSFRTGYITHISSPRTVLEALDVPAQEESELLNSLCWVDQSHPKLPFFNTNNEGLLDCKIFISRSYDGGANWTDPSFADLSPYTMPTPLTGPILQLKNGELACQIELNKAYYDDSPWRHSSVLLFSKDGGRTWNESSVVTGDPAKRIFYWDQRPAVLSNGTLYNLFWTFNRETAEYLPIHCSLSRDKGRSWTQPSDTSVPGQPAQVVENKNGKLVMVYVDRSERPVIKARVSGDGGRTWSESTETVLFDQGPSKQTVNKASMQDAWSEMGKFSLGLPATAYLGADEILVVFYNGPETNKTSIQFVRFSI